MSTRRSAPPSAGAAGALARFFRFDERKTNLRTEVLGGMTTFFVMAYVIFVNPAILTFYGNPPPGSNVPSFPAILTATCLAASLMCLAMGLLTNYPFALASGKGRRVHPLLYAVSLAFLIYFLTPLLQGALGQ